LCFNMRCARRMIVIVHVDLGGGLGGSRDWIKVG
jgi:hypothetical protein